MDLDIFVGKQNQIGAPILILALDFFTGRLLCENCLQGRSSFVQIMRTYLNRFGQFRTKRITCINPVLFVEKEKLVQFTVESCEQDCQV